MDPRGDFLGRPDAVGQPLSVFRQQLRSLRPLQLAQYTSYAVQVYELRPGYIPVQQWLLVKSETFAKPSVARTRLSDLCLFYQNVNSRYRTYVKLFGRRPTGQWVLIDECYAVQ